jgi:hypothetical protein
MYYLKWGKEQKEVLNDALSLLLIMMDKVKTRNTQVNLEITNITKDNRQVLHIISNDGLILKKFMVGFDEDIKAIEAAHYIITEYNINTLQTALNVLISHEPKECFIHVDFRRYLDAQYWLTDKQKFDLPQFSKFELYKNEVTWPATSSEWKRRGHLRVVK